MVGARRGRLCACEEGRLKWFCVCVASAAAARVVAGEAERAVLARGAASGAYARRWRMQVAEHFWPVHAQPLVQPLGWPAVAVAPPLQYESYPQAAAPPCWSIATQPPPAAPYSIAPQPAPTALYGVPLYQLPPYFCSLAPQKPSPPVPPLRIVPQPPPSAHPCSASLQHAPAASAWKMASPCALQQQFETLVMCNYTPRHPRELRTSRWVSFSTLYRLLKPYKPAEVWLMGPGNLKQLITKWYKDHPAFAGLAVREWCRRLTTNIPQDKRYVFKFCFEYTPNEVKTSQLGRGHF